MEKIVKALDRSKNQVNVHKLIYELDREDPYPFKEKLIILEEDIFEPGIDWAFGGFYPCIIKDPGEVINRAKRGLFGHKDYAIVSMARAREDNHIFDLFAHELGHMYCATSQNRRHTVEHFGTHCTNDFCVMQQRNTVKEWKEYSQLRHNNKSYFTYCAECEDDLRQEKRL